MADLTPEVGPTTIVPALLTESNYEYWSTRVKSYLVDQGLWEICTTKPEEITDPERIRKNALALDAIKSSCSRSMLSKIMGTEFAREAWNTLENALGGSTDFSQYERLWEALQHGNWRDIANFLQSKPDAVSATISREGLTPLHLAVRAGRVDIVGELVARLAPEDLERTDNQGLTPLGVAALSGITGTAMHMIRKHAKLTSIISVGNGILPVVIACGQGKEEMTRLLYCYTESDMLSPDRGQNGATLLRYCILRKFLDIAVDILGKYPLLVVQEDQNGFTPLYELGQMTAWFKTRSDFWFWNRWIYSCIAVNIDRAFDRVQVNVRDQVEQPQGGRDNTKIVLHLMQELVSYSLELFGIRKIRTQKLRYDQANRMLQCICTILKTIDPHTAHGDQVLQAIIQAIKQGNVNFVSEIIKSIPGLTWKFDQNGRNIFFIAAEYRQEKIFNILYGLPNISKVAFHTDKSGNTMLHLAAMLPPPNILNTISGAALQMQRELQWFKEAERSIMLPCKYHADLRGKKPSEVFSQQHANLVKEGEKSMKDKATSSSFVAGLVITIAFALAFTVPGGNNDNGVPIFLDNNFFMAFVVSDSIALFSAITSALMFLGISTSEYSENKFLTRLPTELVIGLSFLFISLAAVVVAFCASLAILLEESSSRAVIMLPIVLFACIPVALFAVLQFPHLVRICFSTYGPCIFDKKIKRRC